MRFQTTDKCEPFASVYMQNIPAPSEVSSVTITQDYERERFFLRPSEYYWTASAFTMLERNSASTNKLYQKLVALLEQLWQEPRETPSSWLESPLAPLQECISQAMRCWLPQSQIKFAEHSVPFQCKIMKRSLPEEVLAFCLRNWIYRYLSVANDLVVVHFPLVQDIEVRVQHDPDDEETWLALEIMVQGEVEEVLKQYNSFTDDWISSVPWPERDKIRFSINII